MKIWTVWSEHDPHLLTIEANSYSWAPNDKDELAVRTFTQTG